MTSRRGTPICLYLVTTVSPSAICSSMVKLVIATASMISGEGVESSIRNLTIPTLSPAVREIGSKDLAAAGFSVFASY